MQFDPRAVSYISSSRPVINYKNGPSKRTVDVTRKRTMVPIGYDEYGCTRMYSRTIFVLPLNDSTLLTVTVMFVSMRHGTTLVDRKTYRRFDSTGIQFDDRIGRVRRTGAPPDLWTRRVSGRTRTAIEENIR